MEDIKKVVLDYFIIMFDCVGPREDDEVMSAIECKVTPDINVALVKPFYLR